MADVKLMMTWDILPGREEEYFEFHIRKFVPGLENLGLTLNEAWLTTSTATTSASCSDPPTTPKQPIIAVDARSATVCRRKIPRRWLSTPSNKVPQMPPRLSSTPPERPRSTDRPASTSSFGVQLTTK